MMTQLTDEQIREKTKEKVQKIKALALELQIQFTGKQRLDPETMTIENIVVFTDHENYPIVERGPKDGEEAGTVVPENSKPQEVKVDEPVIEETPNVESPSVQ